MFNIIYQSIVYALPINVEWLTVANLEENNSSQVVSNVETADEAEQQQPTQQFVGGSSRVVNATNKSKKATTKVGNDDGPLADYYGRFDGECY